MQLNTNSNLDHKKAFAFFALLSSLTAFLLLLTTLMQKPPEPNQFLNYFEANQSSYVLFAALSLTWSVATVPVIVSIGLLTKKNGQHGLTITSIILTTAGVLLIGIVTLIYVGACLSIWATKSIPGANSNYEISFWTNLFYFMTDPALMIWGLGQFLLGILLLRNKTFPQWVAMITIIGGVAGLLTLFVFQTPILALLQHLTLLILTTYTCVFLFRSTKKLA